MAFCRKARDRPKRATVGGHHHILKDALTPKLSSPRGQPMDESSGERHKQVGLRTVEEAPLDAWVLGVFDEPLRARRADTDYLCGACGRVIASAPRRAKLSDYAVVQYEAFNEYCPKEVPGLPDYLQPYTTDADYMDFFKPRYNIRRVRANNVRRRHSATIVICYACGANNLGP